MKFSYKARTKEGRVQGGTIEASSRKAALDILEKYGFYVTSLREEKAKGLFRKELVLGRRVSKKDAVVFTRQIGTMLKSAIPPLETLRTQVLQTDNPALREKLLKMAEGVETGSSLSQVFAMYPKIFDRFYISIIKSGEATGRVADSLDYLAEHLERDYNFRQKIKGAMLYPAFVIAVFLGSFFVVVFFILPKLISIFKSFSPEDLPLMTRFLISLGDFIAKGGWILGIVLLLPLFIVIPLMKRSPEVKKFWDKISLKLPLLGDFYKKIHLTRFAENLSVLISAGLPITQALKITEEIIDNYIYRDIVKEAQTRVGRGERINSILAQYPRQFPAFVTQMVATGEDTGKLNKTLMDTVKFYQAEIERKTEKLTTILEPVLILVLGIGIAFLAFAVFIPLFKIGMGGGMGM